MEIVEPGRHGIIIYQITPTAGASIATIHVKDDEKGPHPLSEWARKQQGEENLAKLASVVAHAGA